MSTLSEQRRWERDMVALGISRFRSIQNQAKDGERFTDTAAGSRVLREYLTIVSEEISRYINQPGYKPVYSKLIRGVDYDKLAMFTLYRVVECLFKPATVQKVCASIGKMVEDELRFSYFEIEAPEYYNAVLRDLDSRNSTQYRHRHRVLVSTMSDKNVEWESWNNEAHIRVGAVLLSCAERVSDLVVRERHGANVVVTASKEAQEWIMSYEDSVEVMMPDRMPCIHPPQDWDDWRSGGFYTSRMQSLTPLVKTRAGQQRDTQAPMLDEANMPAVLYSVNAMQKTPWKINKRLLAVAREVWDRGLEVGMPRSQPYDIPKPPLKEGQSPKTLSAEEAVAFSEWKDRARTLHGMEAERKASLMSVVRTLRVASRLEMKELLWIVYQLDFRGRAYGATSGVSPQGHDIAKAVLHFGEAKSLGERGWYWFRVHGANKYGYDKCSYDERVKFVDEHARDFVLAGSDPLANTDVWKDADKPYQFLAWCMEFAQIANSNECPTKFMSRLPVALDGSCNGLQHFSAMLRDSVGGSSVNLVPRQDRPADIYQDVADVATNKLYELSRNSEHEFHTVATNWVGLFNRISDGKMGRKLAKKPVMTLPYGSTLQTCTQSVYSWYLEQKIDYFPENTAFRHCVILAQILWKSISEVVIAARAAMDWIQKCARLLAKHNEPVVYTTPQGFPMVQFAPKMEKKRIEAQIGGRVQMQIRKEVPGIDRFRASSGSSPNLIHSIDATHMHMVVAAAAAEGIDSFAMIHDDFGVHACHIDRFHVIIREQFIRLHEGNLLEDFKKQQEERTGIELPPVPATGDLDISEVRNSLFFFG